MIFFALLLSGIFRAVAGLLGGHRREWERQPHGRLGKPQGGPAWYAGVVVPLAQVECVGSQGQAVYVDCRIKHYVRLNTGAQGIDNEQWASGAGVQRRGEFAIRSEDGQALVEAADVSWFLQPRLDQALSGASQGLLARLRAAGFKDLEARNSARVVEQAVLGGETLWVLGVARQVEPAGGLRIAPTKIWSAAWLSSYLSGEKKLGLALRLLSKASIVAAVWMGVRWWMEQ